MKKQKVLNKNLIGNKKNLYQHKLGRKYTCNSTTYHRKLTTKMNKSTKIKKQRELSQTKIVTQSTEKATLEKIKDKDVKLSVVQIIYKKIGS